MVNFFSKNFFKVFNIFRKNKNISLGLYGPPNAGKSTLANKIVADILGDGVEMFSTSSIEHETREIQSVEKLELKKGNKTLNFSLIDTPGIATKIDFEDFVKKGLNKKMLKLGLRKLLKGLLIQ